VKRCSDEAALDQGRPRSIALHGLATGHTLLARTWRQHPAKKSLDTSQLNLRQFGEGRFPAFDRQRPQHDEFAVSGAVLHFHVESTLQSFNRSCSQMLDKLDDRELRMHGGIRND
jgi:hypothetical protein